MSHTDITELGSIRALSAIRVRHLNLQRPWSHSCRFEPFVFV